MKSNTPGQKGTLQKKGRGFCEGKQQHMIGYYQQKNKLKRGKDECASHTHLSKSWTVFVFGKHYITCYCFIYFFENLVVLV